MSKTLVIYLMAEPETPELARAAVEGGADIVELGFPFSDPLADGPVIRRAAERALARGMRTRACLDVLARTRELLPDTPLVPMTYSSLLEALRLGAVRGGRGRGRGDEPHRRRPSGGRPPGAAARPARRADLDRRADPRSPASRPTAGSTSSRWPARPAPGTTSPPRSPASSSARAAVTAGPLYAGFGISTPEHARAAAELADGVVVGSRALLVAEDGPDALREYVASLRVGTRLLAFSQRCFRGLSTRPGTMEP